MPKSVGSMSDGSIDNKVVSEEPEESEAKKEERLERNREIARKCRKRKRERNDKLQIEVDELRARNHELELQLKLKLNHDGKATTGRAGRDPEQEAQRLGRVKQMIELIHSKKSYETELLAKLGAYAETYSDYGRERRELVDVHVKQLKHLAAPTQVSKMLHWVLDLDPSSFGESDGPGGMGSADDDGYNVWAVLCKDLKLDKRQQKKIRSLGGSDETTCSTRILQMFTLLRKELKAQMTRRKTKMERLMSVITPVQTAKFLEWVERNQACIHLLNSMWLKADHVDSEDEATTVVEWFLERQRTDNNSEPSTTSSGTNSERNAAGSSSIAPLPSVGVLTSKIEPVATPQPAFDENGYRQEPNMNPAASHAELDTPLSMMFQDDVMAVADLF